MNSNPAISYGGGLHQILARLFGGDEGKRIMAALPHLLTAAFGTKRTFGRAQSKSAFGGKADITRRWADVCFWPKADIGQLATTHCPKPRGRWWDGAQL